MAHYNSTHESGQLLMEFTLKANSQEEHIFELFKEVKRPMAWFEIRNYLAFNDCSIKRSLSDLAEKGLLFKTTEKVLGLAGRPCYKYAVNNSSNNFNTDIDFLKD